MGDTAQSTARSWKAGPASEFLKEEGELVVVVVFRRAA